MTKPDYCPVAQEPCQLMCVTSDVRCKIRDAAQPGVQEPVGEVNRYGLDSHGRKWHGIHWYDPNVDVAHGTKLYTTPPAQPATEESSATQPAQRQWVGLTDEDYHTNMFSITSLGACDIATIKSIAKDVEAKLKEKNNG
jgi:hypothetical protein